MSKKYKTTTTLVIVESPAKCKKIEEYLGPGYKCIASFGHLRELKSLDNIDTKNGFTIKFTEIDNPIKKKQIDLLRSEIKRADDVILATDDDREGEGISWHICDMFGLDLKKTKRITFNEITETALRNAVNNPRRVDMNMVRAQQTRQILDLMVGFKFSPVLWKCISRKKEHSLSAGRCQTPALKLVYDNQKEINASPGEKVYSVTGYFTNQNIPFELNKEYKTDDDATDFLDASINFKHLYFCNEPRKTNKKSPEPFTTSRLQQVASNELHYSPKDTMKLCQTLYEGGYITYMRTDSKKYSKDFIEDITNYINRTYNSTYLKPNINELCNVEETETTKDNSNKKPKKKTKSDNDDSLAQNAHEAIRPTNISLIDLPEDIGSKEKRMYKLIRENTLESCMADSVYLSITAQIKGPMDTNYKYVSEKCEFKGWKIVANKNDDDKFYQYLLTIKSESCLPYKKIIAKVTMKNMKSHYTEARLVQLLEERGIGRPSTFSSLIDKIQERGYVKKDNIPGKEIICKDYELEEDNIYETETKREFGGEKNKLVIQNLGELVMEFLDTNFDDIFNYDYTREMEETLDKIANNSESWNDCCEKYLQQIDGLIEKMESSDNSGKIQIKIDEDHYYIIAKHGPVIKYIDPINKDENGKPVVTFKAVKQDIDIDKLKNGNYKLDDILLETPNSNKGNLLGKYEGKDLYIKKGKYGLYAVWGVDTKSLNYFGNRPIENIQYSEVVKFLEDYKKYKNDCSSNSDSDKEKKANPNVVRTVSRNISIRKGKGNDYIFYKTKEMTQPKFFKLGGFDEDYKTCDIKVLKKWIKEKYEVS